MLCWASTERSWDGHGLPWMDSNGLRELVWCSSGWHSPFLVALPSFMTPECLFPHDGAWVSASQQIPHPTGWLGELLSHMCPWPLLWMNITWAVGHETLSWVCQCVSENEFLTQLSLRNAAYFLRCPEYSMEILVQVSIFNGSEKLSKRRKWFNNVEPIISSTLWPRNTIFTWHLLTCRCRNPGWESHFFLVAPLMAA